MSRNPFIVSLLAIGPVLISVPAFAQYRSDPAVNGNYRDGQPMVMTPQEGPSDPTAGIRGRFLSAYTRAKLPRIVIFWNRAFTDQVASDYEAYTTFDSKTAVSGSASADVHQSRRSTSSDGSFEAESNTSAEMRSGIVRTDDARRQSNLSEAVDFDVEQAYQAALSQAGARLIDRTSIMRTTGASKKVSAGGNIQEVEADAVLAKADIVLEVAQMADERAPDGMVYRVVARDVRNARILTSFSTDGRAPVGRQPYVAGPNGFVRASPREPGPSDIGRQLALETMGRLSSAF